MSETRRFSKKPVVIDAVQFDGTWPSVNDWLTALGYDEDGDGTDGGPACHMDGNRLVIQTLEGDMTARPGDWIIRGVQGEFYPCKPDIFEQTYQDADSEFPLIEVPGYKFGNQAYCAGCLARLGEVSS